LCSLLLRSGQRFRAGVSRRGCVPCRCPGRCCCPQGARRLARAPRASHRCLGLDRHGPLLLRPGLRPSRRRADHLDLCLRRKGEGGVPRGSHAEARGPGPRRLEGQDRPLRWPRGRRLHPPLRLRGSALRLAGCRLGRYTVISHSQIIFTRSSNTHLRPGGMNRHELLTARAFLIYMTKTSWPPLMLCCSLTHRRRRKKSSTHNDTTLPPWVLLYCILLEKKQKNYCI